MVRGFVGSLCALAVVTGLSLASAAAQEVLSGTVKHVDPRSGVIVLDDGREVHTTSRTIVLLERPVNRLAAVRPGSSVVVIEPAPPSASPRSVAPDGPALNPFGADSRQAP